MVFPFSGSTDDGYSPVAFFLQEVDSFGLVIRFLIGYMVNNVRKACFVFRRKRISVANNNIGSMAT